MNINCVICSDLFVSSDNIFTTPCGHIFHYTCLIQWLERSKSCPQCRNKCNERNIFRIYFNNAVNLDSTQTSPENLLQSIDELTLKIREKDHLLKKIEDQSSKLENVLKTKDKRIEKLDVSNSRNVQIIATLRHEMDILSSNRANYKAIEIENAELKSKLDLMLSIESVLTASQKEVDEILKQNLNTRDLSVMVGTLRRELNNNEIRKNELRKQIQMLKNDIREEQEEIRNLKDKQSSYESENNRLKIKLRKLMKEDTDDCGFESPGPSKSCVSLVVSEGDINTPSPLSENEFAKRVKLVKESESPYLKVKSSNIALTSIYKRPADYFNLLKKPSSSNDLNKLSIFKRPRIEMDTKSSTNNSENVVYNGLGGTTKVLLSDLKKSSSTSQLYDLKKSLIPPQISVVSKRKKLSPNVLGK
ncbi:CLUMA_CG009851, isoform A [Clunio marinus]|uniref:CLUMA_CG009851, isoform A n=1 Tax=Clunio marinus TaxID=568069 RepID=A0A1J1I893_9DIPT|nr:CLUMA_CG009851, isoform A [Clunio marinus]